jgi:choice-of-anchor A domain-containing protein
MFKQLLNNPLRILFFLLISLQVKSQSPTDPALGFNVFLKNGASLSTNETEGPIALGGDLTVAGNYQVNIHNVGTFAISSVPIGLFVGGKVNFQSGSLQVNSSRYVKIGNCAGSNLKVWYRDNNNAAGNISITPSSNSYNSTPNIAINANAFSWGAEVSASSNPVCDANVPSEINFTTAFTTMQASSVSISACSATGVDLTNPNGNVHGTTLTSVLTNGQVKINLSSGTNVLNVTGTELNSVTSGITFNTTPDAGHVLVINVNAAGSFSWNVWNQAGISGPNSPYILYNFYNTTTLNIPSGATVEGTVFAPFADIIKNSSSNIEGQIIAQSYNQNGGENHFYNFAPAVSGCGGGCVVPTVAAITGTATVCQGSATTLSDVTASGVWSTSNATIATVTTGGVVTGVAAGTATISYAVTNACGTTTVTQPVTVNAIPAAPAVTVVNNCGTADLTATNYTGTLLWSNNATTASIHVTDAVVYTVTQTINGCTSLPASGTSAPNSTVLGAINGITSTCAGYTTDLSDITTGGIWSSDNTAVATVDNNGTVTGVTAGTANITYTVTSGCATGTQTVPVTINDCSGGVSGGATGGLESKSLGDAIAKRVYNKAVNSAQGPVVYSPGTAFTGSNPNSIRTMGLTSPLTLTDILPQQVTSYNLKSYITTPTDLTSMTNATDVLSIDYTLNSQAKAVAFATQTSGGVYDHTKAVCDRLKGSVLVGIQNITVSNLPAFLFTLHTPEGNTEYSMSFVIGASSARNTFTFQSNWLNKDYQPDETMYNIQLWAVSPDLVTGMANQVISNLQAKMPVQYLNDQTALPQTYITAGNRNGTNLTITVNNLSSDTSGYLELQNSANEQSNPTSATIPVILKAKGETTFTIPMNDSYESTIDLYINGKEEDEVYLSDGEWSYSAGPTSTINSFTITNDPSRTYPADELPVLRNVQVNGTCPDYVSLYKLLKGGGITQDLTGYKTLKFTASGGYNLRVTLVKNSIVNWSDQYNALIPLDVKAKDYYLSLKSLVSAASADTIQPNDITTVVFSVETGTGQNSPVHTALSNISFTKEDASFMQMMASGEIQLYPNPTRSQFTCTFMSAVAQPLTLRVIDAGTGRTVLLQQVSAITGINNIPVNLNKSYGGSVMYVVSLEGQNVQYKRAKLITVDSK